MRGYFGIGIYNVKKEVNVGGLWRHAQAFNAAFCFTIGRRYQRQASDTTGAMRHVPMFRYETVEEFLDNRPQDCPLIGVEIVDSSVPLGTFTHPERAIYLLGAEDHGLTTDLISKCQHVVEIPTKFCLNVATTGAIVMYDRDTKARAK